MKLFHCTNSKLSKLTPQIGEHRHSGEDKRAVGEPVVFLSDSPNPRTDSKGNKEKYLYIVEVPDDDPHLFIDEDFKSLGAFYTSVFKDKPPTWYFLKREVEILETAEWDGCKYVTIPNFTS